MYVKVFQVKKGTGSNKAFPVQLHIVRTIWLSNKEDQTRIIERRTVS